MIALFLLMLLGGCLLQVDADTAAQSYALTVFVNDEAVDWEADGVEGKRLELSPSPLEVSFAGGSLTLNLADWNTFDYAHVLAVSISETAEDTYRVSATVRHHDQGWDNYADAFKVTGDKVENGLRVLAHPHDNEQPFTRSQSGVEATGVVQIAAKDNIEGWGGSTISVDLEQLPNASISFELEPLD